LSITGTGTCTVTASLTASNCDGQAWQIKDDGNVKCSGTVSGSSYSYTCPSWTVSSGTYTYKLYIGGNLKDSKSVTCSGVDNPPTCSVSSISESSSYAYVTGTTLWYNTASTGSFTVYVTASDDKGISKVNFPTTVSSGGDDTSSPYSWSYNWDTSDTYSGTATVTAYDTISQTGTCSFTVTRDTTAPTTTASISGSYTITLSCSDAGSGCSATYYCLDTTNTCSPSTVYTGPISTSCSSFCYVRYYSIDRVSNQESVKSTQFGPAVGDTTPPTTSINPNGKSWTNSDVSFTLSCSDNVGCLETKYSIIDATGSCPSYASLTNTGTSGTVSCALACQRAVCYASKDVAGNIESVKKSNTFYVDKVLPTGDISISPSSPTSSGTVTYTATGSDAESGLSQIRIYVDTSLKKTCSSSPCSWTGGPYAVATTHSYYAVIYDLAGNSYTTAIKSFTVNAVCNNNGVCEVYAINIGENQTGCPNDCYTVAYLTPSQNLLPGQEVHVVVYFNDSRWDSTRDASINLTIDGKEWTECQVQNKRWNANMSWPHLDGVWSGTYGGEPITITSMLGYAKLEANCSIPALTSGTHYFKARPTIYSEPTELTEAVAVFYVGTTAKKQENSLIEFIKHLLLLNIF
jgi:hypothetical protein